MEKSAAQDMKSLLMKNGDHHKKPNWSHQEESHKNNITQCI